jgi:hypothetical protein
MAAVLPITNYCWPQCASISMDRLQEERTKVPLARYQVSAKCASAVIKAMTIDSGIPSVGQLGCNDLGRQQVSCTGSFVPEHWTNPNHIDPYGANVIQLRHDAVQIANAIAIAIFEASRIDLVDDTVFPPRPIKHSHPVACYVAQPVSSLILLVVATETLFSCRFSRKIVK